MIWVKMFWDMLIFISSVMLIIFLLYKFSIGDIQIGCSTAYYDTSEYSNKKRDYCSVKIFTSDYKDADEENNEDN